MAFELLKKSHGMKEAIKPDCISVRKNGITFGDEVAAKLFANGEDYLEVYFDYDLKKVGFKATTDAKKGFKVNRSGSKPYLSSMFSKRITPGYFEVESYTFDGMAIFKVPEIVRE